MILPSDSNNFWAYKPSNLLYYTAYEPEGGLWGRGVGRVVPPGVPPRKIYVTCLPACKYNTFSLYAKKHKNQCDPNKLIG
jgi:hypothetical protein